MVSSLYYYNDKKDIDGQDEIRTHKMIIIRRLAIGYTSPVAACPLVTHIHGCVLSGSV